MLGFQLIFSSFFMCLLDQVPEPRRQKRLRAGYRLPRAQRPKRGARKSGRGMEQCAGGALGINPNTILAAPDSLPARIAAYQRRKMFRAFMVIAAAVRGDTILESAPQAIVAMILQLFRRVVPAKAAVYGGRPRRCVFS